MRHAIETAPRDGQCVILENDPAGIYDIAHWSAEVGQWVAENGEPSKVTPTHWRQMPRDYYFFSQGQDESSPPTQLTRSSPRLLVTACAVALIAAALISLYFYFDFERKALLPGEDSRTAELLAPRQQPDADQATGRAGPQKPVQAKQAVEVPVPPSRQSLEKGSPREILVNELSETRRAIEGIDVPLRAEAANSARSLEQEWQKMAAPAQQAAAAPQEPTASTETHRQALGEERARSAALTSQLATAQRENEMQAAQSRKASEETAKVKQAEAASSAQSLEQERQKTAALAREATAARQELITTTAKYRQELDEERARHTTLWSKLAAAQGEIETQAAQLRKAGEETSQLKQEEAANGAQSLEQERQKAAGLAQEAAAARQELTTSTAKLRQELDEERARHTTLQSELATAQREIETKAAQLRKASEEARQLKQATERAMTDLRGSLKQERARNEAMARDIESTRRAIDARAVPEPAVTGSIAKAAEVIGLAATAPPEAQGSPEATRLIARARTLLGQGNIGAARIVLERAAETGSARASFTLAETYDPAILSTWGTYGTRGDTTKARELYTKAHAGGIQDAKKRLERLDQ